ncbi:hypothetical protein DFH07DRAFT_879090, partial [Mycena maculata]
MLVAKSYTVADVLDTLCENGYLPENHRTSHMLATLGRRPQLLMDFMSLGRLGLGSLSHLQLRVRVEGGSRSHRQTPEASSSEVPDSPSKNTRSRTGKRAHNSDSDSDSIPVIISPKKKRTKANVEDTSDAAVWHKTDAEIIAESRKAWKSSVYDHYSISLERAFSGPQQDQPGVLTFIFTCRHDPLTHTVQRRKRMQSSQGTGNLGKTNLKCDKRRGVEGDTNKGAQQDLHRSISNYTPARHRALIALRCASSHRPFHAIRDPFYLEEIELLRPGTSVPSPATVSRDVQTLYLEGSQMVKDYFKDYQGAIHAVIDGWTAPFVASYLGIVIVWFAAGKIHRAILEFI